MTLCAAGMHSLLSRADCIAVFHVWKMMCVCSVHSTRARGAHVLGQTAETPIADKDSATDAEASDDEAGGLPTPAHHMYSFTSSLA